MGWCSGGEVWVGALVVRCVFTTFISKQKGHFVYSTYNAPNQNRNELTF